MRILHVYKDYHPILGGIENHVRTLAELQASAGHEVTVLVTNPGRQPARQQLNSVTVIRAPRLATVASTPLSPTFPLQLRRLRPDITHLHFPYPVGELSQWLAGRRRPYVVTYHSDVVRQQRVLGLYRPLLQRILRGAARILPTSAQYAATSPFLQPLAERCTVVPLSVDPVRFHGAAPLLAPAAVPSLLFVGRHRYYKGLDDLLRALPGLEARLLVGGDGPLRPTWEALAGELSLGEQVHFLGDVSDAELPRLYASADLFVLPANSRAEAFGMVLLEAMASALPCITTEVGTGTSFVVQHGVTGLVVPARDPAALRAALQRLLPDAPRRAQMGAAARARVLAEFTPQQLLARVLAVYEEVV
jgi:glycosyltransferase involved in cell wall biosynthesis